MKTKWVLTQEAFDGLLAWLDPDRDIAGTKFLEINRRLITLLARRGCPVAEELADKTMDRVSRKVNEIAPTYEGDPAWYFCNVAQKVYWEWLERERRWKILIRMFDLHLLFSHTADADEVLHNCLDDCLQKLDGESRDQLLLYYKFDGRRKIETRKKMAEDLGVSAGALTTKAYRLRAGLEPCISNCSKGREDQ